MFVSGKGKDDYLTRAITVPPIRDQKFKIWRSKNKMIMS